jgi:hypothetical protein
LVEVCCPEDRKQEDDILSFADLVECFELLFETALGSDDDFATIGSLDFLWRAQSCSKWDRQTLESNEDEVSLIANLSFLGGFGVVIEAKHDGSSH